MSGFMCKISGGMWIKARGGTAEEAKQSVLKLYSGVQKVEKVITAEEYNKKYKTKDIVSPFASTKITEKATGRRIRGRGVI